MQGLGFSGFMGVIFADSCGYSCLLNKVQENLVDTICSMGCCLRAVELSYPESTRQVRV